MSSITIMFYWNYLFELIWTNDDSSALTASAEVKISSLSKIQKLFLRAAAKQKHFQHNLTDVF